MKKFMLLIMIAITLSKQSIAFEKIISGRCHDNQNVAYIYNKTPADAVSNYIYQTSNLKTNKNIQKPYWDVNT